jgi:hypothetical protein
MGSCGRSGESRRVEANDWQPGELASGDLESSWSTRHALDVAPRRDEEAARTRRVESQTSRHRPGGRLKRFYIYTALWNIDTQISRGGRRVDPFAGLNTLGRYRLLHYVVNDAWTELYRRRVQDDDEIDQNNADWLYLFVAPEYYFAASDTAHAIPQAEKEAVVGFVRGLSGTQPTLVLCPGTIAWKKPLVRRGGYRYNSQTGQLKTTSRGDKLIARNQASGKAQKDLFQNRIESQIRQDIRNAPSPQMATYYASAQHRESVRQAAVRQSMRPIYNASDMVRLREENPDRVQIARNTAYGFYEGREVARYHKRSDFFEVLESESDGGFVIFEPGGGPEGAGSRFEVEHVKFAIEVCLDHQIGFLSQEGGWYPHVQIIMSAAAQTIPEHAFIMDDGYIVHASSDADSTGFYRKRHGRLLRILPQPVPTISGDLYFERLDVTVNDGPRIIEDWAV